MTKQDMKIAFFGTPHFATYVLDAMKKSGITPSLVITVPEKPAGRGLMPRPSPVKLWSEKENVPVAEPSRLEPADTEAAILFQQSFDLFVVAGYGKLLPHALLSKSKHGVLNVHPSLLPKYRGPSPIETQILDDLREIGVSIILLDEETDHGPILAQKTFVLSKAESRSTLEDILWKEGGVLLAESIVPYLNGSLVPVPQNHAAATFTKKLEKEDGHLDLEGDAYKNYLKYLAYERWPGTYFFADRGGKKIRVKIAKANFEDNHFKVLRVVPEGKKEMEYADFERGGKS